jgi:septal ring factor EnvC (AmiA/AmiB activator)
MKRILLAIATLAFLATIAGIVGSSPNAMAAKSKVWTITDRQMELRRRVEKGLKGSELTAKEAKKLNDHLNDIDTDINKMKTKNAGKLSYKDEGKIEKRLNDISLDLEKCELQKRVVAH